MICFVDSEVVHCPRSRGPSWRAGVVELGRADRRADMVRGAGLPSISSQIVEATSPPDSVWLCSSPAFWKHAWKHFATSSPQPKPECPRSFGMHRTTRRNLFPDRSAQTAIRSVADSATDAATGSASAEWCEPGNQRLDASVRRRISSRLRVRTPWQPLCMLYARRTRYLQRPYLQRTSTSS